MQLINKRYQIIETLSAGRGQLLPGQPGFRVRDLYEQNRSKRLFILNTDKKSLREDDFIEKMTAALALRLPCMVWALDFDLLRMADNKPVLRKEYILVTEDTHGFTPLSAGTCGLSPQTVREIFRQVCRAIYLLHANGIVYRELCPETVYYRSTDEGVSVKLCGVAENLMMKAAGEGYARSAPRNAPGEFSSERQADFYALGMLLYYLASGFYDEPGDMTGALGVIKRLTAPPEEGYRRLTAFFDDFENVFGEAVGLPDCSGVRISFEHSLVRHKALRQEIYAQALADEARYICIHGDFGTDKSRVLQSLGENLHLGGRETYLLYGGNAQSHDDCALFLNDFAEQIRQRGSVKHFRLGQHESGTLKFFYDSLKDRRVYLLIDDFERVDSAALDLLNKLFLIHRQIVCIFTYRNGFDSAEFSRFLQETKASRTLLSHELMPFSEEETVDALQEALLLGNKPVYFGGRIYRATYGNPIFIQEVLKSLVSSDTLYFNTDECMWDLRVPFGEYDDLPLPKSIDEAVVGQLGLMSENELSFLQTLCGFRVPVPRSFIQEFTDLSEAETTKLLAYFTENNMISRCRDEAGDELYSFTNRMLRDYVYASIDPGQLGDKHKKAAGLLQKLASPSVPVLEEIVRHLKQVGDDELLLEFFTQNSRSRHNLHRTERALRDFDYALGISTRLHRKKETLEILVKAGTLAAQAKMLKEAKAYFARAELILGETASPPVKEALVTCINLAACYIHESGREEAEAYITRSEGLFATAPRDEAAYKKLYLDHLYNRAMLLCDDSDFAGLCEAVERALRLCSEEDHYHKGLFYNLMGLGQMYNGQCEAALVSYESSVDSYDKAQSVNGAVLALTNIAYLYVGFLGDREKAKQINLKVIERARSESLAAPQAIALHNLSGILSEEFKLTEAEAYAEEAFGIADMLDYRPLCFSASVTLAALGIYRNRYIDAVNALGRCERLLEEGHGASSSMAAFLLVKTEAYYRLGCMDRMEQAFAELLGVAGVTETDLRDVHAARREIRARGLGSEADEILAFSAIIRVIRLPDGLSEGELSARLGEEWSRLLLCLAGLATDEKRLYLTSIFLLYLKRRGWLAHITGFIKEVDEYFDARADFASDVMDSMLFYLKSLRQSGGEKLFLLQKAYSSAVRGDRYLVRVHICLDLGAFYEGMSQSVQAKLLYAEACEVVQYLTELTPEEHQESFIEKNSLVRPFEKLMPGVSKGRTMRETVFCPALFSGIKDNAAFYQELREWDFSRLPYAVHSPGDIAACLTDSPRRNLEILAQCLVVLTCSAACGIYTEDEDGGFVLQAQGGCGGFSPEDGVLEKVRGNPREDVLIVKRLSDRCDLHQAMLGLPVFDQKNELAGYVYIRSFSALSRLTPDVVEECKQIMPLIYMNLVFHEIKTSATLDKLTGVLNRQYLEVELDSAIIAARKNGASPCLLMLDLDHFKLINDTWGHSAGDEVLKRTGALLRDNLRANTVIGRYGGEEFMVLLEDVTPEQAMRVAEKLRETVRKTKLPMAQHRLSVSVGVAAYQPGIARKEWIDRADKALYICKNSGRNRTALWAPTLHSPEKSASLLTGDSASDTPFIRAILDMIRMLGAERSPGLQAAYFVQTVGADFAAVYTLVGGKVVSELCHGMLPAHLRISEGRTSPAAFDVISSALRRPVKREAPEGGEIFAAELNAFGERRYVLYVYFGEDKNYDARLLKQIGNLIVAK